MFLACHIVLDNYVYCSRSVFGLLKINDQQYELLVTKVIIIVQNAEVNIEYRLEMMGSDIPFSGSISEKKLSLFLLLRTCLCGI